MLYWWAKPSPLLALLGKSTSLSPVVTWFTHVLTSWWTRGQTIVSSMRRWWNKLSYMWSPWKTPRQVSALNCKLLATVLHLTAYSGDFWLPSWTDPALCESLIHIPSCSPTYWPKIHNPCNNWSTSSIPSRSFFCYSVRMRTVCHPLEKTPTAPVTYSSKTTHMSWLSVTLVHSKSKKIINPSTVSLKLPASLPVHPMFHVSQLKPVSFSDLFLVWLSAFWVLLKTPPISEDQ